MDDKILLFSIFTCQIRNARNRTTLNAALIFAAYNAEKTVLTPIGVLQEKMLFFLPSNVKFMPKTSFECVKNFSMKY